MTKTRLWSLALLIVGLLAAFAVAGCGDDDSSSSSDTGSSESTADLNLLKEGTLTVGSDIPFPPFEQGDPPDYEGFDIDVINAIADEMGLDVEIKDAPFDLLLSGGGGQFDLAIAATTITPARAQRIDFSDPYFDADQGLLVKEGSDITSVDDLGGTIVGAQDGTTGETYANEETDAAEVRPFPEISDAYNALQTGQVDAVLNDLPAVQDAVETLGGLEVIDTFPTGEQYGIYAAKGSPVIAPINDALQQIKDDGTLDDIYQEWFDQPVPEDLLEPGPAEALSGGSSG